MKNFIQALYPINWYNWLTKKIFVYRTNRELRTLLDQLVKGESRFILIDQKLEVNIDGSCCNYLTWQTTSTIYPEFQYITTTTDFYPTTEDFIHTRDLPEQIKYYEYQLSVEIALENYEEASKIKSKLEQLKNGQFSIN
jgi:hypothetical protein